MTSVSSSVNPSGIVVPAGGLQQGNVAMTTINSQVVSGKHVNSHEHYKTKFGLTLSTFFFPYGSMTQCVKKRRYKNAKLSVTYSVNYHL